MFCICRTVVTADDQRRFGVKVGQRVYVMPHGRITARPELAALYSTERDAADRAAKLPDQRFAVAVLLDLA